MKFDFDEDKKINHLGLTAFMVVAAGLFLYYVLFHGSTLVKGFRTFTSVLAPVIYGLGIAFIINPITTFLENRVYVLMKESTKIKHKRLIRWISTIVALVFFLAIIITVIALVLPELVRSATNLIANIPSYVDHISRLIDEQLTTGFLADSDLAEQFNEYYAKAQQYITNNLVPQLQSMLLNITSGVFDVINFMKNFFVGSLISLYVVADKEGFIAKAKMVVYAILPVKYGNMVVKSMRFTGQTFIGFLSGKILDSAIIGLICYVVCYILNMPYTILVSVIIGVTNIIPFFGPFLGAIPCLFLILLVNPIQSLQFLIFILILQQFDGNILGPKIIGDSTGLSSFLVIVAIMFGGGFFGFPGMLLGVPAFAVLNSALEYLTDRSLRLKKLPSDQDSFTDIDCLDPDSGRPKPMGPDSIVRRPSGKPVRRKSPISVAFMKVWDALTLILVSLIRYGINLVRLGYSRIREWIHRPRGAAAREDPDRSHPTLAERFAAFRQFFSKK